MLKSSNTKLLGGTLLLTGTAMGGGLLALPLATAEAGFLNASFLMFFCWGLMTISALLTLEVSLWLPPQANIISMTAALLKPGVTYIAWVSYLLLLYSITAAYIAGGSDFISHTAQDYLPLNSLHPIAAIGFTAILGSIVYQGIHWIDYLNRGFMIAKLILYSGLVLLVLPHNIASQWYEGEFRTTFRGFSVVITAFAYANMIPSLRSYFGEDIANLRKAILIGSTIPLVCYLLWNMSVMGVIPLSGNPGLIQLSQFTSPASALIHTLNQKLNHRLFYWLSHSFAYLCVFTTFLTCSFGLSDFLADGFRLTKRTSLKNDVMIYGATFVPPLLIALLSPGLFIKALHYAGIYCLILFVLIPVLLAWRGRYHLNYNDYYRVPGGKGLLVGLGTTAILGIIYNLYRVLYEQISSGSTSKR
jgi:tyrosine-specific transport protein